MGTRRDVEGDLFEMHAHGFTVAAGHNDSSALALSGADGTEDVGRGGALILGGRGTGSAPCPAPCDPGLLADPRFILPPQLNGRAGRQRRRYRCQLVCEAFLKSPMASSLWP